MANQKYFFRILAILNRINRGDYPSQKTILEDLAERGYLIETRTFERDKNTINEMFNIELKYSSVKRGYYTFIEDDDVNSQRLKELFDLLSSIKIAGHDKIVSFEQRRAKGTDLMPIIIDAIKNKQIVSFEYLKFFETTATKREVEPYMLKESLGRWYLIAKDRKDNKTKTFGLDRIEFLNIEIDKFKKPKNLNIEQLYHNSFGVINVNNVQEIIIDIYGVDAKYVATYPLHHSQKIVLRNKTKIRFSLNLAIASDFIMELLKYNSSLEVIKPLELRKEIYSRSAQALKLNK